MKKIVFLLLILIVASCSNNSSNLTVKGNVKGLKKGTIYLSRVLDSTFQVLDSTELNGTSDFELKSNLEEPEVLFLSLDANSTKENYISFFADKGETEINTTLKRFTYDYKVNGSNQQAKLDEYLKNAKRFNDRRLDLIKLQFEALSEKDTLKADSLRKLSEQNLKRRYLYTINFAINNKDSEVAPYIALSEAYDANIKYLDTVYNVLPDQIANSKYGKTLKTHIEERKNED